MLTENSNNDKNYIEVWNFYSLPLKLQKTQRKRMVTISPLHRKQYALYAADQSQISASTVAYFREKEWVVPPAEVV